MNRKLYKSNQNKMIAGVCGGLGEFFDVDPTLIRLLWVIFALAAGSGLLVYIASAIIIPEG
ncbi:MAG: PspC domain-containing protein [Floccifex porci]|uniref:PspC domain-containing protein n=1 Tax=Floccifex porci TaxID=2606629 RepID=A0A7X2N2Y5_9FIRM|nr:PspC domain-containing protein [Floccifex porci]MCI7801994.1 PspC domain-containing protein [Erysipelotrichaceae bacterium]MDD7466424.1 PspC domain-containing protein [Floccifex porci]MDO4480096.1 PspC domain-containing protein [Erysipelotrichaceae bacterium]MDY4797625.1 PspC domain-containing protein [Floccifex porci]MSS00998.1 PspC domain-containing protein [Floccifex porci]